MITKLVELFFRLVEKITQLSPTQRFSLLAHFLIPGLILGIAIFFSGGISVGFEQGVAISQLRTEITAKGVTSTKPGVIVIAEPFSSAEYLIPVTNNASTIWSSFDEDTARDNSDTHHVVLNERNLYGRSPLISRTNEPIALVIEGDLGSQIEIPGHGQEPIESWRMASRRSVYLVVGVLISCSLALGLGIVIGVPPVNPNEHQTGQV
jgi:hypothetical protein